MSFYLMFYMILKNIGKQLVHKYLNNLYFIDMIVKIT